MELDLNMDDKNCLDSGIIVEGKFFIMDSEQLVANPFQEMQQEAVNEAQKKNSMTERLTSVKNNVCENHFQMANRRLERQKTKRLKQLHDNSNKLRHEVKLLDLDKQRHHVEIKKRMMPERDYSYDEMQIVNTEKRLGANIASFYLDKKMKYPTRLRSGADISVTPTIRKARASIRVQEIQKSLDDDALSRRQSERAATAKTTSSLAAHRTPSAFARRRDSRSAPAYTRNSRFGLLSNTKPDTASSTVLPAIDQQQQPAHDMPRGAWTGKSLTSPNLHQNHNPQSQVKFVFENPLKILASNEESANLFAKSHPYYPGMMRAVNFTSDTSDDEDDEPYQSEIIDLRKVLFGDEATTGTSRAVSTGSTIGGLQGFTQQQLAAIRKAQGPPPKLTTDMKQEESAYINSKINSFLENLAMSRVRTRRGSDDSSEDLDFTNPSHTNNNNNNNRVSKSAVESKSKPTFTFAANKEPEENSNTKSTSTADLPGQTTNNEANNNTNKNEKSTSTGSNMMTTTSENTKAAANATVNQNDGENNDQSQPPPGELPTPSVHTPRNMKYSWRCIRGRQPNESLHGGLTSEDLVLQALTGVPISNMLHGHVPLHSASRAMRHTATFKMHKVVEKMISDRTKYERHQVEELKKQMETESLQGGGAGAEGSRQSISRRISNSSIASRASSRVAAK